MILNFNLGKCIFGYVYLYLLLVQCFCMQVELFIDSLYYVWDFFFHDNLFIANFTYFQEFFFFLNHEKRLAKLKKTLQIY